ncbi:uncharacterized protein PADG_11592 [Paracoccidioides brasiliensis Pb18]|uniref:Uncharacterized protein n=2 Tax=Paracoccidioides brasiliensis TaxID=121759 RepID=A0A0A0HWF1_PARBD|nr:uncharacterized protein PADG_11592 [Paracoccidioides brasiliensis Pb18]KGM92391.1 hypothetical protein PADG_11592 [Paracoccidioides brasiliensis Pb18]ODH36740.1 hypothetical protein ACO22_02689 [Paracoccidioides brasiliensis]
MIRGQQHNGQPLSDLDSNQRVNYEVIEGSVVGILVPRCLAGVLVAGHHLHFLSSDCKRGHGLGLSVDNAMIGMAMYECQEDQINFRCALKYDD